MPIGDRDYIRGKHPPNCTCTECTNKRLGKLRREAHPSYVSICPRCGQKSLWHNIKEHKYECLNLKCKAVGSSVDEITRKSEPSNVHKEYAASNEEKQYSNNVDSEVVDDNKAKSSSVRKNSTNNFEKKGARSRIPKWIIALLFIFALSISGSGISLYIGNFVPFWLLLGFSLIYSTEKWFFYITRKHKGIGKLYRLVLNLSILSLFGLIIWSGMRLFSQQFVHSSLAGSLIFLVEFIFFIWIWRVVSKNSWRWPSMKLTVFSLTVIFIIFAFAGVPPMSTYKDKLFACFSTSTLVAQEENPTIPYPEPEPSITEPEVLLPEDIEDAIFNSINSLRESEGIRTLSWSDFCHEEAKKHSEYMAQTMEYKRPSLGNYENIFYCVAYSAENVPKYTIRSWTGSENYAANLLTDNVTHCGVGLARRDNYYYVTFIATKEDLVSPEIKPAPSSITIPASPEPKPAPLPLPEPESAVEQTPRSGLRDILADINFEKIDQHALNTPESVTDSIEKLAAYITEPAENDLEKAWAIYRWITQNISYDVESYFSGSYKSTNPENVLASRSSICHGYSNLFEKLGKQAGLEVITISGWAKGYSYTIGEPIIGGTNHAWNALKINDGWYLIDSTWGAGAVNDAGTFVKRFVSSYFCTHPRQFIYAHFPEDKDWQLLETPISKDEYENLPKTSRGYIEYNCYLYSPLEVNLNSEEVYEFKIRCPEASQVALVRDRSFIHLKRDGDIFQGNIKVWEGEVILAVCSSGSNTYWAVVEYKAIKSD